jgi:hypothetical protein
MLTISKPLSAGQAQTYHAKEFAAKEQNYWSQKGETHGEWQGQFAARFGLVGAVSAADFARLSQGQHPETGEQLVRQRASYEYEGADGKAIRTMEHRAGWDATFSAPKSVSLTALVGGDDRVRAAHRESVRVALDQLEHYIQIPDARIEYDLSRDSANDPDQGSRTSHDDIEVLTAAYRPGHLRHKAQAGFHVYASSSDRATLTAKIEDDHHLMERILEL